MAGRECNISKDCPETDLGAARFCFTEESFSGESFFCDCSVWYGWTGENCDQETGQLTYYRISNLIQIIWAFFVLVATGRTLILYLIYGSWRSDPVVYTGIFVFMSVFFAEVNGFIQMFGLYDPSNFEIAEYRVLLIDSDSVTEDVTVRGGMISAYCLLLGTACFYFSAMIVIFSWFKVISKVSRFDAKESQKSVEIWEHRFKIFVIVYFVVLVGLSLANMLLAATVVVASTSFVLAITYIVSTIKFIHTLQRFNVADNEKVRRTIRMVRISCIVNMVCLTLISILLICYYITSFQINTDLKPGDFNYALFLRDLALACGMVLATFASWYVNSMTDREYMVYGASRFSCLWKQWDYQHEKLMSSQKVKPQVQLVPVAKK